ncbi:MAG: HNH endonuclease [Hyphomicrobiaceae bacterium]|nr:HNH endonuclease [Hyphomicrobiaceae bacterium]
MRPDIHPALLLNADFRPVSLFPLSLMSWQAAVSDVVSGRVTVIAEYEAVARSPSTELRLPAVVALRRYRKGRQKVAFTRYNVFLRDRFTCQYCRARLPASALTFDHVLPRSKGGETSWTNVVTACGPCNSRKGSSLAMRPATRPRVPSCRELLAARKGLPSGHLHKSWLDYLYWDSELGA